MSKAIWIILLMTLSILSSYRLLKVNFVSIGHAGIIIAQVKINSEILFEIEILVWLVKPLNFKLIEKKWIERNNL